jgi:hypothetical protein
MILNWKIPFSKAKYQATSLQQLAGMLETELGLYDDEWKITDEKIIFDPCSICFVPWIFALRIATYDIVVDYDFHKEVLRFKFRLFKLYIYSLIFAAFLLLTGEIVGGILAFLACFGFFLILFLIEMLFRKTRIRNALKNLPLRNNEFLNNQR